MIIVVANQPFLHWLHAVDADAKLHAHTVSGEPREALTDGGQAFIKHCMHSCNRFANGSPSDVVVLANVFGAFRHEVHRVGWVDSKDDEQMKKWCVDNNVNPPSIGVAFDRWCTCYGSLPCKVLFAFGVTLKRMDDARMLGRWVERRVWIVRAFSGMSGLFDAV